jgi:hypothetical protein
LLPALQFFDQEVISLRDLAEFRIHSTLEVNKILPGFKGIPGVLIPFPDDLIEVTH